MTAGNTKRDPASGEDPAVPWRARQPVTVRHLQQSPPPDPATRALPRWLAVFAALTAAALAVNGGMANPGTVPAFLLFLVWSLATSGYLALRGRHRTAPATPAAIAADA